MNMVVDHAADIRAVRVMTASAACLSNRVSLVFFNKELRISLVASYTEGDDIGFEQMLLFPRCMRVMAVQTAGKYRLVLELENPQLFPEFLVARHTELVAGHEEIPFLIRGMRVMAFEALAGRHHPVNAGCITRDHPPMAGLADCRWCCRYKLGVGGRMRVVASSAYTLAERCMKDRLSHLLVKGDMTLQAEFSACARFQLELKCRILH
jgi:hypothetical protein